MSFNKNDLNYIVTNQDLIFVFDDVIPNNTLNDIQSFDWDNISWNKIGFSEVEFQSTGGWYRNYDFKKDIYKPTFVNELLELALDKFKSIPNNTVNNLEHLESYAIMSDTDYPSCKHEIHQDGALLGGAWSMLYHLVGTEGPTNFYNNFFEKQLIKSVDFKPGRLIVFPSLYPHKGMPQFRDKRITIDYLFKIESTLNKYILDNSVPLKNKYQKHYM